MQKVLYSFLMLVLAIMLTGCGQESSAPAEQSSESSVTTSQSTHSDTKAKLTSEASQVKVAKVESHSEVETDKSHANKRESISTAKSPTKKSAATGSREELAALTKAKSYIESSHMSKKRLYQQLTSKYGEQFPASAAQYAIDHLTHVSWRANALEKAKSYQDHLSNERIRRQLTSSYGEQFTDAEADYAIQHLPK